jgi:alpha-ketoglutarate-dependent taurine dioxygenase
VSKNKDFGFQRGPRPEQPDQGAPDQSAKIAHRSDYQPIRERQSAVLVWVCGRDSVENSPRPKLTKKQLEETPDVAHPIVRTHAWTGRKSLYVTAGECIGIEGLPDDEGVALIEELHAHCLRPEFQYRHKWQVGDLLMWDNATSMHLAICDYRLPERRLMHRTTVAGGVPV